RFAKGGPDLLINDGYIDPKVMKNNNMDVDEVKELLRLQGVFALRNVRYAIIENSGQLSVLQYSANEPISRGEMKEDFRESELSYRFIVDGEIECKTLHNADSSG